MPSRLPTLAILALCLAACAQAPSDAMQSNAVASPVATTAPVAPTHAAEASMPSDHASTPAPATQANGGIEGAIRDGNRAPPALRVCAHPVDGGKPACIDTAAGATTYRIEVAAGRYVVAGQAKDDPGIRFAHAERIRCIRAPCPPDTAIVVEVGAGATTSDVDLSLGEALPPAT